MVYWLSWKGKRADAERERAALETAADRLREKMELPSLADYNQALLDRYHKLATDQADKAYRSSRFAMGLCLAILLAAFCIGWRLNAQGDRLFIGSAAAVGATFTAYLSRTYMQTYERSLQQLNQYFNHPVLNGYFLTAERIAAGLPEDRRHAVSEKIVSEVLESGKEMHHIVTNASVPQTSAPKPGRRRRVPKQEASIPAQQNP
ncbi:hypothetical protein [Streptomyces sp. 3212.3]|uniref:hypothetical protein n=1 Tax=Streptomyces sp. 3212.3 TaxID=1938846 RepID=UPI0011C18F92|nr:hypothetical protein [Streptomyces sp. 3212.3]